MQTLLDVDPKMYEGSTSLIMKTPGVQVSAGAHRVTAAFKRFEDPVNDLITLIDHTSADTQIGVAFGITTLPHLKGLAIGGSRVGARRRAAKAGPRCRRPHRRWRPE